MADYSIEPPAAYVPQVALAFGTDLATGVALASPLPALARLGAAAAAPVTGTAPMTGSASASGTGAVFLPDIAAPDRPLWVRLSGEWIGGVTLERSTDGGAT